MPLRAKHLKPHNNRLPWNRFFQSWYVQWAKVSSNHAILDNFDQIIGQKLVCLDSSWTDSLNCDCMKQFIEVYDEFDWFFEHYFVG